MLHNMNIVKLLLLFRLSKNTSCISSQILPSCLQLRYNHYDVIIAGGGIMGMSSAYFLSQRMNPKNICVVERDPTYKFASTPRSVGSIRQQFSNTENINLSTFSFDFLQNIKSHLTISNSEEDAPYIGLISGTYLFLASEQGVDILKSNHSKQISAGANVEILQPEKLKKKFPWINTEGVYLSSLGIEKEGWFDPWLLLTAFKKKILDLKVKIFNKEITNIESDASKIKGVTISNQLGTNNMKLSCSHLVNTCGVWSDPLMKLISPSLSLPIRPKKRMVFSFKCPTGPKLDCPLVVDPTGLYFRREGSNGIFICGLSPPVNEDNDTFDLEVDYNYFDERIWPVLATRVKAFENLKATGGWAGSYDYNIFDQNGIIDRHDEINNLIIASGFSGHGIQQSPAVGRAVSEIILDGHSHSINISKMGLERVKMNRPAFELNII